MGWITLYSILKIENMHTKKYNRHPNKKIRKEGKKTQKILKKHSNLAKILIQTNPK